MMMVCFEEWLIYKGPEAIFPAGSPSKFLPLQNNETTRLELEPAQNLSSGFVGCSCAVVITTAPPDVHN